MKTRDIVTVGAIGAGLWWLLRPKTAHARQTPKTTTKSVGTRVYYIPTKTPAAWSANMSAWPKRITNFGGSEDKYESHYDIAFLPRRKRNENPAQYYARMPKNIQKLFRSEMATTNYWPIVDGWQYKYSREQQSVTSKTLVKKPAGLCWFLDTKNADYCAIQWVHPSGSGSVLPEPLRAAARAHSLYASIRFDSNIIFVPVIDEGMSGPWCKVFDCSEHLQNILNKRKITEVVLFDVRRIEE